MSNQNEWITLGNSTIRVSFLQSVTEDEALEHFKTKAIHDDRVRNAWKQANNFKSPNRKIVEKKVVEPKRKK